MKTQCLAAALAALLASVAFAAAQGTAFTYQGRLNESANPASGVYDLRFAIYDAAGGGSAVGGPLTNAATEVNNGLFTISLDFGAGVFTGSPRWLEIEVRTNGSVSPHTVLAPRQRVAATPYAIYSANAGSAVSVAAANITGIIPVAQLPASVVTNGASGVNLAGTFTGNGAGVTNVPGTIPSQMVTGTSVQAQPNTAYNANSATQVTVVLPTNASAGDVVRVNGLGAGGWQIQPGAGQSINQYDAAGVVWTARETSRGWISIASSADGSKLVAADLGLHLYTSTDSGTNWIARENNRYWRAVASSADGSKLVAVVGVDFLFGQIYTSTDGGTNWIARATSTNWWSVASSADGSKLVAVVKGGQIYTSTDSGTNWTARESSRSWLSVASSADGSKLVAVVPFGQIYTSTDSGTNWVAREPARNWQAVASSADGSKLVVAEFGGRIFTSTDSGTNWVARETNRNWYSVASSADGINLIAATTGDRLYTSTDGGVNWTARESSRSWSSVASSADGNKLVAAVYPGQIYTSSAIPFVGAQGSSVELQNTGNGVWQQLNRPQDQANPALLPADQTFSGQNSFINSANSFTGNGSGLTSLNAGNLTGSVPPATLTSVPAGNLTGSVPLAALTSVPAVNLIGTVLDTRLSANVALRAGGNTFTGGQIFNGQIRLDNTDGYSQSSVGNFAVDAPFVIGGRVMVLTNGNVGIGNNAPQQKLHVIGNILASGTITPNSDRNAKTDVKPVDPAAILERVARLPIQQWRFKAEPEQVKHVGPMAQDFRAAFGLGEIPTAIATVDADGVALAAIQGLNQKLTEELKQKETKITELTQRLEALEQIILGRKQE